MMVKTQVQIPDRLYRDAKRVAREYEMSFAEVVRRGLEKIVPAYPPLRVSEYDWRAPEPQDLGVLVTDAAQLRDIARESDVFQKGRS